MEGLGSWPESLQFMRSLSLGLCFARHDIARIWPRIQHAQLQQLKRTVDWGPILLHVAMCHS